MKTTLLALGTMILLVAMPLTATAALPAPDTIAAAGVSFGGSSMCIAVGTSTLVDPSSDVCNFSGPGGDTGTGPFDARREVAVAAHLGGEEICFIFLGPNLVDECSTSRLSVFYLP